MKERIKFIIDDQGLTPTSFSDLLDINKGVISHILSGRNKPSLEVVKKILSYFSFINPDWLLEGREPIYKDDYSDSDSLNKKIYKEEPSLFSESEKELPNIEIKSEYQNKSQLKRQKIDLFSSNKAVNAINTKTKKISQIIIYYDDNTFEALNIK